jgi:protein-tyrosine-phosphatase
MAEVILRHRGRGRFQAFSAGSHPRGKIDPPTLELLERIHYSTEELRSKDWMEFVEPDSPPLDFVFTVCDQAAGEICPAWPGQPMTAHWGVEDPVAFEGPIEKQREVFKRVYRELDNRIKIFSSLQIDKLDRLSLQKNLDEIGKTRLAKVEFPKIA